MKLLNLILMAVNNKPSNVVTTTQNTLEVFIFICIGIFLLLFVILGIIGIYRDKKLDNKKEENNKTDKSEDEE